MEAKDLIQYGLATSFLAGVLYQLKNIPSKLFNLIKDRIFYKVCISDGDELFYAVEAYLYKHHSKTYRAVNAYLKDENGKVGFSKSNAFFSIKYNQFKNIAYSQDETIFYIKYSNRFIYFAKSKKKIENAQSIRDLFSYEFVIKGIKCKHQILSLLEDIASNWITEMDKDSIPIFVYRFSCWEKHSRKYIKPFSRICIENNLKSIILSDLKEFDLKKDWYKSSGIPYKRTYLLYGKGGCGKSTIAQSISSELNRSLCVLNIGSVKDDEALINAFTTIPENSVLLIEDVDAAFVKRDNEKGLSLSCLLNCLDGSLSKFGLITIITTNHYDKLDEFLLRDGRIDLKQEILPANKEIIEDFLFIFYGKEITINDGQYNIPISTIQEVCIKNKNNPSGAISHINSILTN